MELITKYFPELETEKKRLFTELKPIYAEWNAKINVISRKDFDAFYCNHVLHSLALTKAFDFSKVNNVLDIGTGGGFPGIPLAIMYPEIQFTLVDSIGKKIKVVQEVATALHLDNINTINDRFENIKTPFPLIVSRAVAPALKLVNLTQKASQKGTVHLFLKGGDLAIEKKELLSYYRNAKWRETAIYKLFIEDFFETKKIIKLQL